MLNTSNFKQNRQNQQESCPICGNSLIIPGLQPKCATCGWIAACIRCQKWRSSLSDRGLCPTCEAFALQQRRKNRGQRGAAA